VAVVVEGEVEPLAVFADEAVGVVHAAFGAIDGLSLEDALVGPGLHAVKADPERHRRALLAVGIVQDGDAVAAEIVEGGFAAWIGDVGDAGELWPSLAAVLGFCLVKHAAEAVGADDHGDAAIVVLKEIVFCPAEVSTVGRESDVAVLGPGLAAVAADEHSVAWVGEVSVERCFFLLIVGSDVVLKRDHEATVFADDVLAHEGALFEASWDCFGLAPGLEGVVAGEEPRAPVIGPMLGMGGEKEGAMLVKDHELGGTLSDGFTFAGKANIEGFEWGPSFALVITAGDAGVVQGAGFGIATGQHEEDPGVIGKLPQGRIAHHFVGCDAVIRDAFEVLLGVFDGLCRPLRIRNDGPWQLWGVGFVDYGLGQLWLGGEVCLGEGGVQNLCIGVSIPIIEEVNAAIGGLKSIGIRDLRAVVDEQSFAPGLTIVVGEEGL